MITYSCERCERATEVPLEAALQLIARNRARCQICGGGLVFPAEVTEVIQRGNQVGERNLSDETEYSCARCERTMHRPLGELIELVSRKKTGCQVCGAPLVFPEHVHDAFDSLATAGRVQKTALTVNCPKCRRAAKAEPDAPDQVLVCAYCRAAFQPPLHEGTPARLLEPEEVGVAPLGAEAELPPPTSTDWGLFLLGTLILFAPFGFLLALGEVSGKIMIGCWILGGGLMGQRRVRHAASGR